MISPIHFNFVAALLLIIRSKQLIFSESTDAAIAQDFLENEYQLTALSHSKPCSIPELCWRGKCILAHNKRICLCPEGYTAKKDFCKSLRSFCKKNRNCNPGYSVSAGGREICVCPPGFISNGGACQEVEPKCLDSNCTPGICNFNKGKENCLCPEGYTVKDGMCLEISLKESEKASVIMMMVIVASASVIVTVCFGVCICYFFRQRSQELQ